MLALFSILLSHCAGSPGHCVLLVYCPLSGYSTDKYTEDLHPLHLATDISASKQNGAGLVPDAPKN